MVATGYPLRQTCSTSDQSTCSVRHSLGNAMAVPAQGSTDGQLSALGVRSGGTADDDLVMARETLVDVDTRRARRRARTTQHAERSAATVAVFRSRASRQGGHVPQRRALGLTPSRRPRRSSLG
jgi:hypothetical protein